MANRRAFRHAEYFKALNEVLGPRGFTSHMSSDGLDQILYDPNRIVCAPPPNASPDTRVDPALLAEVESRAGTGQSSPRRTSDAKYERWIFDLQPQQDADSLRIATDIEVNTDWKQQVAPIYYGLTQQHTQPGEDPEGGQPVLGLPPLVQVLATEAAGLGRGMKIAVIDTGINDVAAAAVLRPQIFDPDLDVDVLADPTEPGKLGPSAGHGTFIASLIHCVAPGAEVMHIRVTDPLGACDEEEIATGVRRAVAAGADIINLSLGGYPFAGSAGDPGVPSLRAFAELEGAVAEACETVAVVAAAGNCGSPDMFYPAAFPDVVGVAALDDCRDRLWEHSNYGSWVAACARGVGLQGLFVNGEENKRYDRDGIAEIWNDDVNFATWGGTSFAAPLVAAQIAILAGQIGVDARTAKDHLLQMAKVHSGTIPCGKRIMVDLPGQT